VCKIGTAAVGPWAGKRARAKGGISSDARLSGAASDVCLRGDFAVPRGVATRGQANVTSPHGIGQGSVRKEQLSRSGVEGQATAVR
jgi:hypothetical protein